MVYDDDDDDDDDDDNYLLFFFFFLKGVVSVGAGRSSFAQLNIGCCFLPFLG